MTFFAGEKRQKRLFPYSPTYLTQLTQLNSRPGKGGKKTENKHRLHTGFLNELCQGFFQAVHQVKRER